jgi:hypothetical protein
MQEVSLQFHTFTAKINIESAGRLKTEPENRNNGNILSLFYNE